MKTVNHTQMEEENLKTHNYAANLEITHTGI